MAPSTADESCATSLASDPSDVAFAAINAAWTAATNLPPATVTTVAAPTAASHAPDAIASAPKPIALNAAPTITHCAANPVAATSLAVATASIAPTSRTG